MPGATEITKDGLATRWVPRAFSRVGWRLDKRNIVCMGRRFIYGVAIEVANDSIFENEMRDPCCCCFALAQPAFSV